MTKHAGITETVQMKIDRKKFIQQVNPVLVFVDEECNFDPVLTVLKTDLYGKYSTWCKASGLRQLSKIRFYAQIMADFPTIKEKKPKEGGQREYAGIDLKY